MSRVLVRDSKVFLQPIECSSVRYKHSAADQPITKWPAGAYGSHWRKAVRSPPPALFPPFVSFPRHLGFEEAAEKEQIILSFMISKGKSRRLHKENWQDLKLFAFHTNQKFSKFFFSFLKKELSNKPRKKKLIWTLKHLLQTWGLWI